MYLQLGDTVLEPLDFDLTEPAPAALSQAAAASGAAARPEGPRVGYRMMALEVEGMDEALAYLATNGVQPSRPPYASGAGSLRAEIRDPDGLPIELRQW